MNDLDSVAFLEKGGCLRLAGEGVPVELHNYSAGAKPQLAEEPGDAGSGLNLSLFSVDLNYHQ